MNQISKSTSGSRAHCDWALCRWPIAHRWPWRRNSGLFRKYGLNVVLSRELGWASIRDKIVYGELEAAHALAGMPFAATLGLGSNRCDCVTALVLNLHGNAITLSHDLWQRGVRDGATLREEITASRHEHDVHLWRGVSVLLPQFLSARLAGGRRASAPSATCASSSCRRRRWWQISRPDISTVFAWANPGIRWPCKRARAGPSPPARNWIRSHPEKVLMVTREFAEKRAEEHLALVAALLEACEFCAAPENREQVVAVLALPEICQCAQGRPAP